MKKNYKRIAKEIELLIQKEVSQVLAIEKSNKRLEKALLNLEDAFAKVVNSFEGISKDTTILFDEKYPFSRCFHDVTFDVYQWVTHFNKKSKRGVK